MSHHLSTKLRDWISFLRLSRHQRYSCLQRAVCSDSNPRTYMYFTETRQVVGYCLDLYSRGLSHMCSQGIIIHLSRSIVRQQNSGENMALYNLASLSNFFSLTPIKILIAAFRMKVVTLSVWKTEKYLITVFQMSSSLSVILILEFARMPLSYSV